MIISGDRQISTPEIQERIARAANGFKALGLRDGTPVGLMLRNDFALFEASAAAAMLGSPVVPINWHLKAEEVAYILADSGAHSLVCHADMLPQIKDGLPKRLPLLVVKTPPEIADAFGVPPELARVPEGLVDWNVWRDGYAPSREAPGRASPMFYTSGTTGRPKGVRRLPMLPEQMVAAERVSAITYGLKPNEDQVILMNGPMYHSAPNSYGMLAFRHDCTIVLEPRFDPEDLLQLIERHKITHMHMVPTMFVRLLRLPDEVKARYDLSSLRFVVHGAASCPIPVKQAMIAWWGPVVHEYFGSTETGIPIWHSAQEALAKPGTVGRAIEGGIVKIFGPNGEPCGVNEIGEIFMRQTAIPDFHYHRKSGAREEAGREGLVSVGDVGYLDEDGYLFLCDRKRDMVISGGQHLPGRDREHADRHGGRARLRRVRDSGRRIRRAIVRLHRAGDRRRADAEGCAGLSAQAAGELQGAERHQLPRCTAARGQRQDLQAQAARSLLGESAVRVARRSRAQASRTC